MVTNSITFFPQSAFFQFAMAFRCDQYTLPQRLQAEEHDRAVAQENLQVELSHTKDTLQVDTLSETLPEITLTSSFTWLLIWYGDSSVISVTPPRPPGTKELSCKQRQWPHYLCLCLTLFPRLKSITKYG